MKIELKSHADAASKTSYEAKKKSYLIEKPNIKVLTKLFLILTYHS